MNGNRLDALISLRREMIADHLKELEVVDRWISKLVARNVWQIVIYDRVFAAWQAKINR